jgi:hypothetical protein
MRADWTSLVIEDLCAAKARGETFEYAWRQALARNHPRARDERMPGDEDLEGQLVLRDVESETVAEFLRRVCGDAWHDRRPELRHFSPASLAAGVDRDASTSLGVRVRGRMRAA